MTTTADVAAGAERSRPPLDLMLAPLAAGLGGAVIGLQYLGTGQRPLPSTVIFAAGVAAALVPLRFGLPLAAGLACFQTTIDDFFGAPGRYWKEVFIALLVLRVLRRYTPSRQEAAVASGLAFLFLGFLLAGSSFLAVGWAAKILVYSIVGGWAIFRLRPARDDWTATYHGLAVAAGANAVLAVWQRAEGWDGLYRLGLPYGDRIRQAPSGALRSFGGFTTAAPFAYTLALITLAWIGFFIADPAGRRVALRTAWVPLAALTGIALSLDRIALVGLTAAVLLGGLRRLRRRATLGLLVLAPVVVGAVLLLAGSSARFLLEGFTFGSKSAETRRALWREYGRGLTFLGHGPATAGAAYERAVRHRAPTVDYGRGWYALERDASGTPFRWMPTRAVLLVGKPGRPRRPTQVLMLASSARIPRTLTVSRGRRALRIAQIPATSSRLIVFDVPAGRGRTLVRVRANPPAARPGRNSPNDRRRLAIRLERLTALDAGPPRDASERIYARVKQRVDRETLHGTAPGVVDNLYLSWLFQYGFIFGLVLCGVWIAVLVRPTVQASGDDDPLVVSMRLWGLFLLVAALVVNVWEEFPVDFLVAIGFAQLYAAAKRGGATARPRRTLRAGVRQR